MELDDCGKELRLCFPMSGYSSYSNVVEPVMVVKAPRGTLVVFSSPTRQCEDGNIIIEQGNQIDAIRAFMEQHRDG